MFSKIKLPKIGTIAAKDFFSSWADINRLFEFLLYLVGNTDQTAENAHNALIEIATIGNDTEELVRLANDWDKRNTASSELAKNRQLFVETILVRHVENYINYLSSVLFEIFISRPETLKSSDKVEVSRVLEHESIDSLVREIAEIKVDSLSYSSFSKIVEFFAERFHITIASEEDIKLLSYFIEIRNISVHNRCFINKRFISRTGMDSSKIGHKKNLYGDDLEKLIPKLAQVVISVDLLIRRRLKVKGIRFNQNK